MTDQPIASPVWPHWQRFLFRFFFIYLLLQIAQWDWGFGSIPVVSYVLRGWFAAVNWAVTTSNAHIFHVRATLVPVNGSGDTSWAWAAMWLFLGTALLAAVVWTGLDHRRTNYTRLLAWLRLILRYYLASVALGYGIIKLYGLQMPFPTLSQLATPLGDLLPMRLSWLFIGYSFPYQFFSGAIETLAGLLLLYRRTITAGLFVAVGAFTNVLIINLAYDVPVKLFASHLVFSAIFLLILDAERLLQFLVLNRGAASTHAYDPLFTTGWSRRVGIAMKAFFVFQTLLLPLKQGWDESKLENAPPLPGPFRVGVYDVRTFVRNRDTIPVASLDTLRWKDVIIDDTESGSVNTGDPVFWRRYGRGYFRYKPDTAKHTMAVWKTSPMFDSTFLFTVRYEVPDTNTILFHTVIRGDSIHAELVRRPRHFQLTERQFHWLSEYNR